MAKQRQGEPQQQKPQGSNVSRDEQQQQQHQGATHGGSGAAGAGATAQGGGATRGADTRQQPGGEARGERERSVPTSREGSGETQPQRSGSSAAAGSSVAQRQPSPMSSVLLGDPFTVADQMIASPFSFMRRFSEEMDRLFADFGFGPASYGSTGYGTGGYGLANSSAGLGNREVGQRQGRSQALQPQQGRRQGGSSPAPTRAGVWAPQIELFQRGNELVVRADLPGLDRDDVNVEVENGVLWITGERREQHEDRREGFYHSERSYGSFHRAIPLPDGVNEDQINAQFRDGVLEVTIPVPRQEQQRGRRVEIR